MEQGAGLFLVPAGTLSPEGELLPFMGSGCPPGYSVPFLGTAWPQPCAGSGCPPGYSVPRRQCALHGWELLPFRGSAIPVPAGHPVCALH